MVVGSRLYLTLIGAVFAARAHAQPASEPRVRLIYVAPEGCASAAAFENAVRSRRPTLALAGENEQTRSFVATLRRDGAKVKGTLEIEDPSSPRARRTVSGETCDEVAEAIGLMVGLLIESEAPSRESGSDRAESRPTPADIGPIVEPLAIDEDRGKQRTRSSARTRDVVLGIQGEMTAGPAPQWLFGPRLFAGWTPFSNALSLRLSATRSFTPVVEGQIGDAQFTSTTGRLEGGLRSRRFAPWWAELSASFEAGELRAEGSRALGATSKSALWLAPGAAGRVGLEVGRLLELELQLAAFAPLIRPNFYFARIGEDSETVHEVDPFSLAAGIGVGFKP